MESDFKKAFQTTCLIGPMLIWLSVLFREWMLVSKDLWVPPVYWHSHLCRIKLRGGTSYHFMTGQSPEIVQDVQ